MLSGAPATAGSDPRRNTSWTAAPTSTDPRMGDQLTSAATRYACHAEAVENGTPMRR